MSQASAAAANKNAGNAYDAKQMYKEAANCYSEVPEFIANYSE